MRERSRGDSFFLREWRQARQLAMRTHANLNFWATKGSGVGCCIWLFESLESWAWGWLGGKLKIGTFTSMLVTSVGQKLSINIKYKLTTYSGVLWCGWPIEMTSISQWPLEHCNVLLAYLNPRIIWGDFSSMTADFISWNCSSDTTSFPK